MEQKIDKRSKEYKAQQNVLVTEALKEDGTAVYSVKLADKTQLDILSEGGLSVMRADFHAAVNNAQDVPENYLSEKSDNPSRRAEMWLTAGGNLLICKQNGKWFGVPAASCKFFKFK